MGCDTDRALKNNPNEALTAFIMDKKMQFNDKQLLSAINALSENLEFKIIYEKDRLIYQLLMRIANGNFEFK